MENIKDARYFSKKIVEESRHKFIYAYKYNRKLLIEQIISNYHILIDNKLQALYMKIDGLPKIDSDYLNLNKSAISIMNSEYLNFSIASEVIKSILNNNDIDKITKVESTVLNYINRSLVNGHIDNLQALLLLLNETKLMYSELYLSYLHHGILEDPTNKTELSFLQLEGFVHYVKKMLGTQSHISIVLDHEKEVSLESYKAINNLVGSRINGEISMNILTEPDAWKTYIDQRRQLIEATHDYENVEYDESCDEYMMKMKKMYQDRYR